MKRKKNNPENPNIIPADRRSGILTRYRERLEKESREQEKKRNSLFRSRVNSASDKKAPETLRTKAYYRFSSKYPSVVSPDGFRENAPEKEKMSAKAKILLAVICILVFVASFIAIRTGMFFSSKAPDETELPVASVEQGMRVYSVSAEDFSRKSAVEIKNDAVAAGCNSVLVEFKSEYGYVYFDVGSFIGASAQKQTADAEEKIRLLSEEGIECIAYISCFKDSVAASVLSGMEVLSSDGSLFRDSSGEMWLDPYDASAKDYIFNLIKKADEMDFRAIMLDNVCFPTEFYLSLPVYPDYDENISQHSVITDFVNEAVAQAECEVIICCDITAFSQISLLPNEKYGATLLDTDSVSFCLDLRLRKQYDAHLEESEKFRYVDELPLVFVLDAADLALKELGDKKEAYIIYVYVDKDTEKAVKYAEYSGIDNIIA